MDNIVDIGNTQIPLVNEDCSGKENYGDGSLSCDHNLTQNITVSLPPISAIKEPDHDKDQGNESIASSQLGQRKGFPDDPNLIENNESKLKNTIISGFGELANKSNQRNLENNDSEKLSVYPKKVGSAEAKENDSCISHIQESFGQLLNDDEMVFPKDLVSSDVKNEKDMAKTASKISLNVKTENGSLSQEGTLADKSNLSTSVNINRPIDSALINQNTKNHQIDSDISDNGSSMYEIIEKLEVIADSCNEDTETPFIEEQESLVRNEDDPQWMSEVDANCTNKEVKFEDLCCGQFQQNVMKMDKSLFQSKSSKISNATVHNSAELRRNLIAISETKDDETKSTSFDKKYNFKQSQKQHFRNSLRSNNPSTTTYHKPSKRQSDVIKIVSTMTDELSSLINNLYKRISSKIFSMGDLQEVDARNKFWSGILQEVDYIKMLIDHIKVNLRV